MVKPVLVNAMLVVVVVGNISMAACALWTVYCFYHAGSWGPAVLALLGLGFVAYKFGPAPSFAVATSILHFKFGVVGLWLPITSYVWAVFTLVLQIASSRTSHPPV
jgi:hypothetical protein